MSPQTLSKKKRRLLKTHTQFDGYDLDSNEQEATSNQLVRFQAFTSGNSLVTYAAIDALCSLLIKDESKRKAYFSAICKKLREFNLLDRDRVFDSLRVSKEKIFQIFQIFSTFMTQMTADDFSSNIQVHNDRLILSSSCENTFSISYYKEHFLEIEEIAKGGFGVVCKAQHKLDNIIYAVKKIHFKYSNDLYFKKVIQEARSFAALKHENIVNYNNAWIENCISKNGNESSSSSDSYNCETVTENEDENFHCNSYQYLSKNVNDSLETCEINSDLSPYNFTDVTCVNTSENTLLTSSVTITTVNKNSKGQSASVSINQLFEEEESYMFSKTNYSFDRGFINSNNKSSVSVHLHDENLEDSKDFQSSENENLTEDHSFDARRRRHSSGATCSTADESITYVDTAESLSNSKKYNRVHSLELPKDRELVPRAQNVLWDICHLNLKATLYIQMELCDKNLRQLLDERATNYNEDDPVRIKDFALNIFCQVLRGVEYIHSKSIIHRDLKPNNIFLCNTSEVKIGDFGLATICKCTEEVPCCPPSHWHSGVHGTYPYSAPEQKTTNEYDAKVDIYSLGIILVELLHPCKTSMEFYKTVEAILQGDFPEKYRKNWPELVNLIKKLTSDDHKERPSTKEILSLVACRGSQVNKCSVMKSDEYFKSDICCSSEVLNAREISQYEAKIDEIKSKYEAKINDMKCEYEARINEMKCEYEAKINEMKCEYETKINEMKNEYEAKIDETSTN